MERLKYNTPYPPEKLQMVKPGQKLSVVVGPDVRTGIFKTLTYCNLILSNSGFALIHISLAEIRSFCLIREDKG